MMMVTFRHALVHLNIAPLFALSKYDALRRGALTDMFGFKIEVPKREGSLKDKTRAIYLDMQVRKAT